MGGSLSRLMLSFVELCGLHLFATECLLSVPICTVHACCAGTTEELTWREALKSMRREGIAPRQPLGRRGHMPMQRRQKGLHYQELVDGLGGKKRQAVLLPASCDQGRAHSLLSPLPRLRGRLLRASIGSGTLFSDGLLSSNCCLVILACVCMT